MDVDRRDGDLQPGAQPQEEPARVELPHLRAGHEQGPADEEAHHGEGEEGGLPAHGVHQVDRGEGAEERAQGEEAA